MRWFPKEKTSLRFGRIAGGTTGVEYALIAASIAVTIVAGVAAFGEQFERLYPLIAEIVNLQHKIERASDALLGRRMPVADGGQIAAPTAVAPYDDILIMGQAAPNKVSPIYASTILFLVLGCLGAGIAVVRYRRRVTDAGFDRLSRRK
jgi:Flp pilus assembly pilin Flp